MKIPSDELGRKRVAVILKMIKFSDIHSEEKPAEEIKKTTSLLSASSIQLSNKYIFERYATTSGSQFPIFVLFDGNPSLDGSYGTMQNVSCFDISIYSLE